MYSPIWFFGMLCYFVLCVHITMCLIEFELVTVFALLLLPWALMPGFAFMAEGAIASIVAISVRLAALAAITSIGLPLVQSSQLSSTGDPGYYQLTKTLVGCGVFALMSWIGPGIAGSMISGTPSGLGSSALVVGAAFTGGVIRGVSQVASHVRRPAPTKSPQPEGAVI
jgi:type IV secretory pathway TrbL component